ncbi:MAG: hypothetical protein F6K26_17495 [Moorea sp. SIO2I5]|nr:hypothetical protein [Moorena sp. SIO2I5]
MEPRSDGSSIFGSDAVYNIPLRSPLGGHEVRSPLGGHEVRSPLGGHEVRSQRAIMESVTNPHSPDSGVWVG